MGWRAARILPAVAGMFFVATATAVAEPARALDRCAGKNAVNYRVAGIRDGNTIVTEQGVEIRLAGVVAPTSLDADPQASARVEKMLGELLMGKSVSVRTSNDKPDRYGRITGQIETDGKWVQAALVSSGEARVASHTEGGECTKFLLAAEREARLRGAGNWSDPRFAIHGPFDLAELKAAEGRFMVVEGVVRRVGESGGRVYLDFGTRFNEDFSVIVPREANKAFTSAGIDLRALGGVRLRVRGIVSIQGGPAIVLRDPLALELLKAGGA